MRRLSTCFAIALLAVITVDPIVSQAWSGAVNEKLSTPEQGLKPSKYPEVARLLIPSLGINEKVIPGTTMDVYNRGVGLWPTSPMAGQRGNFVVGVTAQADANPFDTSTNFESVTQSSSSKVVTNSSIRSLANAL